MPHDPKILDHEYDGIQEFDNPTPGWWHFLFFLFLGFRSVLLRGFDRGQPVLALA